MLLLIAVVQNEDAPALSKRLMEQGLRLTQISSTGGFFGSGSVALLLGIEEAQVDAVNQAIAATCKIRTKHISAIATPEPTMFYFSPVEVEVGGAVVFGVPVERFVHIPGGGGAAEEERMEIADTGAAESSGEAGQARGESNAMKLIVSIVHADDAGEVIRALLAAGQRLTRINTTGGFLRRGNATLLIGVEPDKVDEVINLIQNSCKRRAESAPLEKGIPEYAANVFVLDAPHFIRV